MAAEPVPIDSGSCDECNLCCVLNVVEYDGCFKLYWQCNCPGGTLSMQFLESTFFGWMSIVGWAEDGPNYWYQYHNTAVAGLTGNGFGIQYRLACTLASGEVFYSNSVGTAQTSNWNPFQCADVPGDVKTYGAEVDFSVQPYTSSGPYPGVESWGVEVDYTVGVSGVGMLPTLLWTYAPTGEFFDAFLVYQNAPGGEIRCGVRINGGGSGYWQARRDVSDLTKGWRCYDNCPSFDEFTAIPSDYYLCSAFNGTPPNTYCSNGVKFRVKEIRIVTS